MKSSLFACLAVTVWCAPMASVVDAKPRHTPRHNVIIFVADGLRSGIVNSTTAPAFDYVRSAGVNFCNSHSVFPTLTTVNASAIATGHGVGDTGEYANSLFLGQGAMTSAKGLPVAEMEDDAVLTETNGLFGGNYLNEESLLSVAARSGFNTAAIGKEGPTLIQDIAAGANGRTIVVDDSTGSSSRQHVALSPDVLKRFKEAGLDPVAPPRGSNGISGNFKEPGTHAANVDQQSWFVSVATKVVLKKFKADKRPFVMVYWSRDPDGSQHYNGDSLNSVTPGINGPTSMAGIRNASDNLQGLIDTLKSLDLYDSTNIIVTADHGFSTISKHSETSLAAKYAYPDVVPGNLPVGFLAIDLSQALGIPLHDLKGNTLDPKAGQHPTGSAMLAESGQHPDAYVVAAGGSDLIYLDPTKAKDLAPRIVAALSAQDYISAIFVDESVGSIPGTLPLSAVGLKGSAKTPLPTIFISFRSYSTGCSNAEICAVEVADTVLQEGQGMHGSLSRADSHNFMAAIGPDFKRGIVDPAPVSNADLAPTVAHILHLELPSIGHLQGRVATEVLKETSNTSLQFYPKETVSGPGDNGFVTALNWQVLKMSYKQGTEWHYYDSAGSSGRTVGFDRGGSDTSTSTKCGY